MQSYHLYENDLPQEKMQEWSERNDRYRKAAGHVKGGDTVLDIGCSSGYGGKHLQRCAWHDGVERDREAYAFAEANYAKLGACHFHWSDALTFLRRVPNRHYKVVLCLDVLHENTGDERALLEQMVRVCDRTLLLAVRPTPSFTYRDAIAVIKRLRPKVMWQELLSGDTPLLLFHGI